MKWIFPQPADVPPDFAAAVGGHPLVAEILIRRGITAVEEAQAFLDPSLYTPADPTAMPDVNRAAMRLADAIASREKILVWGDFDVDGQTSTALLFGALKDLGANVGYHIPHRKKHGHGVQPDVLKTKLEEGYDVILTCDTGVAAHDAVDLVNAAGKTIIITDHHALPPFLPDAYAVVNPQRVDEGHPLHHLPGVGVAYILMQQLYRLMGREGEEKQFLDLVALGIVSDVATQKGDTRYLLQQGIDLLRNPQRTGLQALMRTAQVDALNLSAETIGFQIGPRLNALGRLDDASLAVELLTTTDEAIASQVVQTLENLNNDRKQIESQIYAAAQAQVVGDASLLDFEALVMAGEKWHPGVVGIVASRMVEQYGKPAVLLVSPPGQTAGGSARSVPGVDIGAAIASVGDMLLRYGGHPGAAGCSLDPDLIPQFRRRLSNAIPAFRDDSVVVGKSIDAEVRLGEVDEPFVRELERLAPFGAGNSPIHLVIHHLTVENVSAFGTSRQHRRVTVTGEDGASQVVTWWRGSEFPEPAGVIDLMVIPRMSNYKGEPSLQLEWVDSRLTPGVVVDTGPRYEFSDLRTESDPVAALPREDFLVWADGLLPKDLPFAITDDQFIRRHEQKTAGALVIWTAPPGYYELQQMAAKTGARKFYVVGRPPDVDSPEKFLKRLGSLVKFTMSHYGGEVPLSHLAGGMAEREVTVRRGLEWYEAKGELTVEWLEAGGRVRFSSGGQPAHGRLDAIQDDIHALLAETYAYRTRFRRSQLELLFDL